jgi:hypothetical protein
VKSIFRHALGVLLLVGLSGCHDGSGSNGAVAANTSEADLRPAPQVSTSASYALHSEIPTAAAGTPVATSKQYTLVLGSVANGNQ